jgi:spermidine synthase
MVTISQPVPGHAAGAPRSWARFDWSHECDSGVVRVALERGAPSRDEIWRRLLHDEMTQPFIFETATERRLHFSWDCTQSTLLRHQPQELVAMYTRKMMAFLLMIPAPRHILMLGLGGGELARFCSRRLPQADFTVVEIDAGVIALREEFCFPPDGRHFRVVHGDGAEYLRQLSGAVDVLLVDAFDRRGIAPSLASESFYRHAAAALTETGVLVMNFWGDKQRFVDNLKPAARAFGRNIRLVNVPSGNLVLFAGRQPLPETWSTELDHRATRLQQALHLDFPRYLRRLCQGESLT